MIYKLELQKYVDEIKNQRQVFRTSINRDYTGVSFPKGAIVKRFEANNQMLICSFNLYNGRHMLKTAYICEQKRQFKEVV